MPMGSPGGIFTYAIHYIHSPGTPIAVLIMLIVPSMIHFLVRNVSTLNYCPICKGFNMGSKKQAISVDASHWSPYQSGIADFCDVAPGPETSKHRFNSV